MLLRNIALTAFRGTVYGQSLNPGISRARTAVDVLVRNGVDAPVVGRLGAELRGKVGRVREWAGWYVVPGPGGGGGGPDGGPKKKRRKGDGGGDEAGAVRDAEELPPDTQ